MSRPKAGNRSIGVVLHAWNITDGSKSARLLALSPARDTL